MHPDGIVIDQIYNDFGIELPTIAAYRDISISPRLLWKVLWSICREEALARNVDEKEFSREVMENIQGAMESLRSTVAHYVGDDLLDELKKIDESDRESLMKESESQRQDLEMSKMQASLMEMMATDPTKLPPELLRIAMGG